MAGLPSVSIEIGNGNLGSVATSDDGISAIAINVEEGATGVPLQFFSMKDVENHATKDGDNQYMWYVLNEFYNMAGEGAEIWVMLHDEGKTYSEMITDTEPIFIKANGKITTFAVTKEANEIAIDAVNDTGLPAEINDALPVAQALAVKMAKKNMPIRCIMDGAKFNGVVADLPDNKQNTLNRVAVCLSGVNEAYPNNSCVGLLLGRKALIPVQRNLGRVKDGQITSSQARFTDGSEVEDVEPSWDSIHKKGYIFLRSYIGRAGYYVSDCPTVTSDTDDFSDLPRGWVMDKSQRITYDVYLNNVLDEILAGENGLIHPAIIKSWESAVESRIETQMAGEVSGVKAYIDPSQDFFATDKVAIKLGIQPVGYAKIIEVELGFTKEV